MVAHAFLNPSTWEVAQMDLSQKKYNKLIKNKVKNSVPQMH